VGGWAGGQCQGPDCALAVLAFPPRCTCLAPLFSVGGFGAVRAATLPVLRGVQQCLLWPPNPGRRPPSPLPPVGLPQRPVYEGPPGPGHYSTQDFAPELLSTHRSLSRTALVSTADRSATGPFGPALRSGKAPGPADYVGPGATALLPSSPSATVGFASRDVIATVRAPEP
jgi:hypothetical protein